MATKRPIVLGAPAETGSAEAAAGSALFIGNATVLIRFGGFTVLTDPNFLHRGDRAYLGRGVWSKRRTEPAMEIAALPLLDLIVLSHLHDDHFDRPTRRRFAGVAPVITTPHAAKRLTKEGFEAHALKTWETQAVTRDGSTLRVTSAPGIHSTNAVVRALMLPPVMGTVLEFDRSPGSTPLRIYISGDTLMYDGLRGIPDRYPDIDVAMLHLGGTRVLGMQVTMDGEQGAQLLELVQPRVGIPIHYDDYTAFKSPLADFTTAAGVRRLDATSVVVVHRGEAFELKAGSAPEVSG